MSITTKSLKLNDDLDDILDSEDEEEVEEEDFEEELEEEEVEEVKPVRKVKKVKPKDYSYVTLVGAATYSIRGKTYRRNEPMKVKKSELKFFEGNGWFVVRQ